MLGCLLAPFPLVAANRLLGHPSPYLAMHGEDPVDWQPWGRAALEQARRENKLLFISSGYFACHWCHVMQRESYRDPQLAAFINKHFVPVKVDRELQPALDAQLIDFVERSRGSAGWPLNVFLTPEGYPLVGATYLPADEFRSLLESLQQRWAREAQELARLAREAAGAPEAASAEPIPVDPRYLRQALRSQWLGYADELQGGFGGQSRFPMAPQLLAGLELLARQEEPTLEAHLRLTLEQMAGRALRDHIGGGFFRYCVDPGWETPHFEKMLYDNALLARLYLRAARQLAEPRWEEVAREALDFLLREMCPGEGGCVASFSAVDAEGVEGGYYLWTKAVLGQTLPEADRGRLQRLFGLDRPPRFEAGYLLVPAMPLADFARAEGLSLEAARRWLDGVRGRLLAARSRRSLPVDDKRLAGWNALVLSALVEAAQGMSTAADRQRFRAAADRMRLFLLREFRAPDGSLRRARGYDETLGRASLEDYAYVAEALWAWAEAYGDAGTRQAVQALVADAWQRFHDARGWRLDDRPLLPWGSSEPALADGALPSPSAVLIRVSLAVAARQGDSALRRQAEAALLAAASTVRDHAFWYASHVALYPAPGD
ncbi:DUF255 domain-containing protein [Thiohalobacter sp. IOR34]|uniref:thioredoxin domain-containing protein n=1 Tax=Thiohalobacter sp. IOR34 TaxID=3057176 RepID=UPI0025B1D9FA|nr:DUF255 domain-containing protein [Thiohalobacter sp. IOR34]WJW75650.1 DUF255 domain-containing protein [Thiohalobacter sp. IOR34]